MNLKFFVVVILSFLLICCSTIDSEENDEPQVSTSKVVVFDNFDPDYNNPPFGDKVTIMNTDGLVENTITGFNNCQNVGGNRVLSVSDDGQSFVVCEMVTYSDQKISKYDISGNLILSIPGNFTSVSMHDNFIYAFSGHTISVYTMYKIDASGNIIIQNEVGQFDHVVDPINEVLWTVGGLILKADLNLNELMRTDPINWCAVSVDVNTDGSIWVAERKHPEVAGSENRLLKISPSGETLQVIDQDSYPMCIRVNKSTGNFWATGEFGLKKFDPLGNEIISITELRGFTIAIDPFDNSIWVGCWGNVRHYSSDGLQLGIYTDGFSIDDQKRVGIAVSN